MLKSREGSSGNQWESDGGKILVTFTSVFACANPSHNLAGLQVARPCATSPAVCLLEELRFPVDNKGLDLISLAAVKLLTHVAGVPQVNQIPFLQRGSQREALSELLLLECLPFLAEPPAWDSGPKQLSTSDCYRAFGFCLCALESLGWALYSTCVHTA